MSIYIYSSKNDGNIEMKQLGFEIQTKSPELICDDQGKGTGGLQSWNSTRSLLTTEPLWSQNVSPDWWKRLTFLWSSHMIPTMVEHGSVSGAYTHRHLTCLPRAIMASITSSGSVKHSGWSDAVVDGSRTMRSERKHPRKVNLVSSLGIPRVVC